jgi:hypothetical protein
MFEIEHDIDVPASRTRYPFSDMLPGDSIFFASSQKAVSARVAAVRYAQKHNPDWVFTLRKINGGWRLWRVS